METGLTTRAVTREVRLQRGMKVIGKGIGVVFAEVRIHAANRHIDFCHLPGIGVCLLAVDGERTGQCEIFSVNSGLL